MTRVPLILIVEDDAWQADVYLRILEHVGWRVCIVGSGQAAIDALDNILPDAVLLDLFLPGPNGLALLHEVRSHSDFMHLPIIVCSGSADMIEANELRAYGVHGVLDKATLTPSDLVASLKRVVA